MPIYAYRCSTCGYAKDVLQKMSDPVLVECPECHAQTFRKQLTAAGFQLKGSGWYATDFRGGDKPKATTESSEGAPAAPSDSGGTKAEAPASAPADGASGTAKTEAKASAKSATPSSPAAAPPPAASK